MLRIVGSGTFVLAPLICTSLNIIYILSLFCGQYLELSPYSVYTLKFPPFGCFELDSTELFDRDYLILRVAANVLSGDCTITATAYKIGETPDVKNAFLYVTGSFGVPLVVGQIAGDIGNYKNALVAGGVAGVAALSEAF